MPETHFSIRWPDGSEETCYSPSSIVNDFFRAGETYPLQRFVGLSRTALTLASDRVEARFGHRCLHAAAQLARIEARAEAFRDLPAAEVACLSVGP